MGDVLNFGYSFQADVIFSMSPMDLFIYYLDTFCPSKGVFSQELSSFQILKYEMWTAKFFIGQKDDMPNGERGFFNLLNGK